MVDAAGRPNNGAAAGTKSNAAPLLTPSQKRHFSDVFRKKNVQFAIEAKAMQAPYYGRSLVSSHPASLPSGPHPSSATSKTGITSFNPDPSTQTSPGSPTADFSSVDIPSDPMILIFGNKACYLHVDSHWHPNNHTGLDIEAELQRREALETARRDAFSGEPDVD